MEARVLQTYYKGYKFRSRLEARWAVFFDSTGLEYLYELEGYEVDDGVYYLPDFYLKGGIRFVGEEKPRDEIWVEIKPTKELSEKERQKIAGFVKKTGKNILLIGGDPGPEAIIRLIERVEDSKLEASEVKWIQLEEEQIGLITEQSLSGIKKEDNRIYAKELMETELITGAYEKARKARFEKEENQKNCERCGRLFQPRKEYYNLCYSCYQKEQKVRSPESTTVDIRLSRQMNLIIAGVLLFFIVVLLGWATYQIINLPNTLFKVDEEVPSSPTRTTIESPTPELNQSTRAVSEGGSTSTCSCSDNDYNCRDFESQEEAQACFNYCKPTAGDVHFLDEDSDEIACEGLS